MTRGPGDSDSGGSGGSDTEWVSWAEAAKIAGVPVHTIEWWKRRGRIEHRPEDKRRPTLLRSSVVEFAWWHHGREERLTRARQAEARRREESTPPEPTGWMTSREVAAELDVQPRTVRRLVKLLGAVKRGRQWWFPEATVQQVQADRESGVSRVHGRQWVSHETAAQIIGCHPSTVAQYAARGVIERRDVGPRQPSLDLESVEAFAQRWKAASPEVHRGSRRHVTHLLD